MESRTLDSTRRRLLGLGVAASAHAAFALNPIARALAQPAAPDPAASLAALRNFTGTVAHADHYGPFVATVTSGKVTKITPTSADKRPTEMLTIGMLERTYDKSRIHSPVIRKGYLDGRFSTRSRNTATKAASPAATEAGRTAESSARTCCKAASSTSSAALR